MSCSCSWIGIWIRIIKTYVENEYFYMRWWHVHEHSEILNSILLVYIYVYYVLCYIVCNMYLYLYIISVRFTFVFLLFNISHFSSSKICQLKHTENKKKKENTYFWRKKKNIVIRTKSWGIDSSYSIWTFLLFSLKLFRELCVSLKFLFILICFFSNT